MTEGLGSRQAARLLAHGSHHQHGRLGLSAVAPHLVENGQHHGQAGLGISRTPAVHAPILNASVERRLSHVLDPDGVDMHVDGNHPVPPTSDEAIHVRSVRLHLVERDGSPGCLQSGCHFVGHGGLARCFRLRSAVSRIHARDLNQAGQLGRQQGTVDRHRLSLARSTPTSNVDSDRPGPDLSWARRSGRPDQGHQSAPICVSRDGARQLS